MTAARVGDAVRLRWTTPGRTTDGVTIEADVLAEICRGDGKAGAESPSTPCVVTGKVMVRPGASESVDQLGGELASGSAGVLAYRVQLRGKTGKTAGPSSAAYVVSGAAPEPVRGLKVTSAKAGAVVEWAPGTVGPGDTVELERTAVALSPAGAKSNGSARPTLGGLLGKGKGTTGAGSAEVAHFSAGPGDSGGVLDRTAALGATYRYTAHRVRSLDMDGRRLEIQSVPSDAVTVTLEDVFPPEAPVALVAAPGPGSIDLSWEPGVEPGSSHVVGFRVYRRDDAGGEWRVVNQEPLRVAAYRDTSAEAGARYRYRVTAVDAAGRESGPSTEVVEGLRE